MYPVSYNAKEVSVRAPCGEREVRCFLPSWSEARRTTVAPPLLSLRYSEAPETQELRMVVGSPQIAKQLPVEWDWRTYERWGDFLKYTLDVFNIKFDLSISSCVLPCCTEPQELTFALPRRPHPHVQPFLHFAPLPSSLPSLSSLSSNPTHLPQHVNPVSPSHYQILSYSHKAQQSRLRPAVPARDARLPPRVAQSDVCRAGLPDGAVHVGGEAWVRGVRDSVGGGEEEEGELRG